ncbi:MAG: alpha/beta hydrolase [Bacteroidetes bacterium]|nr:alpha/beta hydrolase [Bacteroidota bacterium]
MFNSNFIDHLRFARKPTTAYWNINATLLDTDFGTVRVFDTGGEKPVLINAPDGPNVIEHQLALIEQLSKSFRVICFEFPGVGFSYPSRRFNYSIDHGAALILQVMDILGIARAVFAFSCSNGYYAIKATERFPERVTHLFLSQTPSFEALQQWSEKSIPKSLRVPVLGQTMNAVYAKKFAAIWYKYALPKGANRNPFVQTAHHALGQRGCFCLSGLVQGLNRESSASLHPLHAPATLVWGKLDFTHRHTAPDTIHTHLPGCEIIEFAQCGHFPELENTTQYATLIRERVLR